MKSEFDIIAKIANLNPMMIQELETLEIFIKIYQLKKGSYSIRYI